MDEVFTYFIRRRDLASNTMRMLPRNSSSATASASPQ